MRFTSILCCAGMVSGAAFALAPDKPTEPAFATLDACSARENELSALAYKTQEKQRGFTKASAGWTAAESKVQALWKQIENVSMQCLRLKLRNEQQNTSIKPHDNADALARMISSERNGTAAASSSVPYSASPSGAAQTAEALKRQASESGWQTHEQQVAAANARAEQQIREMEAAERAEATRWAAIHAEEEERAARVRSQNSFPGIVGGIVNQTARNVAAARSGIGNPSYVSPGHTPAPRATPIPQQSLSLDEACPGLMNALEQSYRNATLPNDAGICARLRQELAADRQSADMVRQCRHPYATEAMPNIQQKIAGEVNAGFSAGCGSL